MARSGLLRDLSGATQWHRVSAMEFPPWETARQGFLMNERRGWRRDLAVKLGIAKNNLARFLDSTASPNFEHYLGLLGFLEERGVTVVIRAREGAARPISNSTKDDIPGDNPTAAPETPI